MPTVAFNFRKIRKGNVTMRIWDVAGVYVREKTPYISSHTSKANQNSAQCGNGIVMGLMPLCKAIFSFCTISMLISCSFVVDSVDVSDSTSASHVFLIYFSMINSTQHGLNYTNY